MQLNPELAYAMGGPFTSDQAALIVPSADSDDKANRLSSRLEQSPQPGADRCADAGASSSPDENDDDTSPYRAST